MDLPTLLLSYGVELRARGREYVALCINHADGYGYSEDETHQQECGACGKTFTYTTMIHFSYSTRKADCLNGGEHDYRKTATYPPEFARLRCKMCDDEKPLPANV